jgi:hypothetical protein
MALVATGAKEFRDHKWPAGGHINLRDQFT